jgi:hypothetical protein
LTNVLNYTLIFPETYNKWDMDELYYTALIDKYSIDSTGMPFSPPYFQTCALEIQNSLDHAFIQSLSPNEDIPDIKLHAIPIPPSLVDTFILIVSGLFPLLYVVVMIYPVNNLIKVLMKFFD